MLRILKVLACNLVATMLVASASAQDFREGFDAYKRGDYDMALEQWAPLADDGDTRAKLGVARIYAALSYDKRDIKEAVRYYKEAAADGNASAMGDLGELYYTGRAGTRDELEALKWFELAEVHGSGMMQERIELLKATLSADAVLEAERRVTDWMDTQRTD